MSQNVYCVCRLFFIAEKNCRVPPSRAVSYYTILISLFWWERFSFHFFSHSSWQRHRCDTATLNPLGLSPSCWLLVGMKAKWSWLLKRARSSVWISSNTLWWMTSDWKQKNKSISWKKKETHEGSQCYSQLYLGRVYRQDRWGRSYIRVTILILAVVALSYLYCCSVQTFCLHGVAGESGGEQRSVP